MSKKWLWVLPLLVVFAFAACNTGASNQGKAEKAPVAKTPEELGKMIGDDYWAMMDEVKAVVAPRPSVNEIRPKLKAVKDRYVDRFVAYGRQREAMSQQERSTVNSQTILAMNKPGADISWLNEAVNHYRGMSAELAEEITSMNILTQYSDFELLKKQAPKEAERLGIR